MALPSPKLGDPTLLTADPFSAEPYQGYTTVIGCPLMQQRQKSCTSRALSALMAQGIDATVQVGARTTLRWHSVRNHCIPTKPGLTLKPPLLGQRCADVGSIACERLRFSVGSSA